MAIKDNPGITTMPRSNRDWNKFINEFSAIFEGPDNTGLVTLDTNQTITGLKVFTQTPLVNSDPMWTNANVGAQINLLAEVTDPDESMDYMVTYNASSGAGRKVLLNNVVTSLQQEQTAINNDNELLHHWYD